MNLLQSFQGGSCYVTEVINKLHQQEFSGCTFSLPLHYQWLLDGKKKGTTKEYFLLVAKTSPEKTLCLRGSPLFRGFYLNHKAHKEHKGKALLSALRVLCGSNSNLSTCINPHVYGTFKLKSVPLT